MKSVKSLKSFTAELIRARKAFVVFLLVSCILLISACGNSSSESAASGTVSKSKGIPTLSFKDTTSYEDLKVLSGSTVKIKGYMATSSPADGSFMFLMNLPYQNCPFCKPNTSELSNTMEVYPKDKQRFDYTTQAIAVTGTLEVAEKKDEPFSDKYGYEFNFRITHADYIIIDESDLSEEMALWQKVAESGIIDEIYTMYDYVNFLCSWPIYSVNSYENADGEIVPGYYLYPSDAEQYLALEDGPYYSCTKDGYFDGIIKKIQNIDETAFSDLIDNIKSAEALAQKAQKELDDGNYTYEYKYVEEFQNEDYVYTLNNGEELQAEMETLYLDFSNWLGNWEL